MSAAAASPHLAACGSAGLEPVGGDAWIATDDDPQFHFDADGDRVAGHYRLTAWLAGDAVHAPVVYLDDGGGWREETAVALSPAPGGGRWSRTLWLPGFGGRIRLDPGDRRGALRFAGLEIEAVAADAALLDALAGVADREPLALGRRLALARQALSRGDRAGAWSAATEPRGMASAPKAATAGARAPEPVDDIVTLLADVADRPLVTVVAPASAGAPALAGLLRSLKAQHYPDWEMLVVDGEARVADDVLAALPDAPVSRARALRAAADRDGLGVVLDAAEGAWLCLASANARFHPEALLALVAAGLSRHGVDLVYGDLERVEADGAPGLVEYRPDWNPALAAALDYVRDPALLRRAAIDAAPAAAAVTGWDALHHDLVLRVAGAAAPAGVVHLPQVLAQADGPGPVAGTDAVAVAHFARLGAPVADPAEAREGPGLPDDLPEVALVIPTRDRLDLLRRCVDSVLELSTYPRLQLVVVDNRSREPETLAWLASKSTDPRVRVLAFDEPFNYSRLNNVAVASIDAPVIGLLNNDVEVITPGWIEALLRHALRPDVGAAGAMLYYPDDTIQHAGVIVGLGGVAGHAHAGLPRGSVGPGGRLRHPQDLSAVTAACLLVRREVYREVGGLDEGLAVAFNDVDFCLRLRAAGYRVVWTPHAELYHHESASRGSEDSPEKQRRFRDEVLAMQARWADVLQCDPAYHPALSLVTGEDFLPARAQPRPRAADVIAGYLHGRRDAPP